MAGSPHKNTKAEIDPENCIKHSEHYLFKGVNHHPNVGAYERDHECQEIKGTMLEGQTLLPN